MRITRPFTLLATVFVYFMAVAAAHTNVQRDTDAEQVARAWFTSLMQGQTAVTTSLSEVPFDFDREQEIKEHSDLKRLFDQFVEQKGKRDLKPSSIQIKSSSTERVEVVLTIADVENEGFPMERFLVTVKPGDAFRVVGFSD